MKAFFPYNFPWPVFIGLTLILRVSFVDMSWTSYFAIILSLHHFLLFFISVGKTIPIRYLLGVFMCLQFFIGPTLAYNGFDEYQYAAYRMKIHEDEYFAYAIPAVLSFILGLHIYSKKLAGEHFNVADIQKFAVANPEIQYYFIILGFLSSVISGFFSSDIGFVFYLLGSFKYIGLFLIVFEGKKLRPLPLILVFGSIISSSLGQGMFHDLLTWIIFTACIYGIKYHFDMNVKLIGLAVFLLLAITIQLLKGTYRDAIKTEEGGVDTFKDVYRKSNENNGLFSYENLAEGVVRINQGFILTNIMYTIPASVPFSGGDEMKQILEAAVLPRVLAPNKLNAGDREIFAKYSGIRLRQGTSMGLSSLGDAYINWGVFGGCIFMFVLGFLYSEILKVFAKQGIKYPILLLFTPLVFYYPIRPDCELQTILGHVVKSCFLIFIMITFWKDLFISRDWYKRKVSF